MAVVTGAAGAHAWRGTLGAHAAVLAGIGLSRFAYTPLIPALIGAHWFLPAEAGYLGAANLAGYLAGALMARPLAARWSAAVVLRSMMLLTGLACFACAVPLSFLWFFSWRFLSGLAGGALMALAAPTILPHVSAARRGLASGIIFAGVGLGIVLSGTLVPLLLSSGLVAAWCGLGALNLALALAAWRAWPETPVAIVQEHRPPPRRRVLLALYLEYALSAMALVPSMVFLVDFIARGLGQGLAVGARYWVVFGVGALVGPVVAGETADRIGFRRALPLAFGLGALGMLLPTLTASVAALILSSVLVGGVVTGGTALVLGRVRELLPGDSDGQTACWGVATTAFAVGQAASAYLCSFLFAQTGSYDLLFGLGTGVAFLALAIDLWAQRPAPRR